jgi:phospholipase/lecithinase/hemolysin
LLISDAFCQTIYKKGGRKFGFTRLPPLGLVPTQRPGNRGTCVKEVTSIVNVHNKELPKHLEKLKSKLQGFKYSIAKLDTYLTERINNPSKYGVYAQPCTFSFISAHISYLPFVIS